MDLFNVHTITIFYLKIAFIWKTMKIPLCTFIRNTVRTDSMIEIPLCTLIQDCTIIRDTRVKGKSTFHKACKEGQSDVVETIGTIFQIHLIVYLILFGAPGFYNSVTSIHYVVFLKLTQVAKQQQDFKGEIRRKSLVSRQLRWHKKHKLVKRKIKITKGKKWKF